MLNIGQGVLGKYGQINRSVQPAENAKHFFKNFSRGGNNTSRFYKVRALAIPFDLLSPQAQNLLSLGALLRQSRDKQD